MGKSYKFVILFYLLDAGFLGDRSSETTQLLEGRNLYFWFTVYFWLRSHLTVIHKLHRMAR